MPRGPRLALDNSIFHIVNRGNARQEVFHDEGDFEKFLSIVAYYKDQWGFKVYHLCLMPNHFHFLWQVKEAKILSQAMHDISVTYTRAHHRKYNTVGYLWQGRFKNMIIESNNYLLSCGAYIERNAKRAGLVKAPEDWRWSSYRFYAFGEPMLIPITNRKGEKKIVALIDENPFYKDFGKTQEERERNYRRLAKEMDKEAMREKFGFKENKVLGGEKFKTELKKKGLKIEAGRRGRPSRK